jgi:hypothetical protein
VLLLAGIASAPDRRVGVASPGWKTGFRPRWPSAGLRSCWDSCGGCTTPSPTAWGLDTVLNLVVNLALFATVGVLCGVLWAFVRTAEPSPAAAVPGAMAESGGDLGGVADAPDGE